jgi:hypothetical protein
MSKYSIQVITDVSENPSKKDLIVGYYQGIDENDNVVMTDDPKNAAQLSEKAADEIIDYLNVALDYLPRTYRKIAI